MSKFDEEVMSYFSKRLKAARKAAGYEHAKNFADALGVEPHAYRHWERGGAQPSLTVLTRICRLLEVEPNDLLPLALKSRRHHASSDHSPTA